jgi:GGDEF domain-containing protein
MLLTLMPDQGYLPDNNELQKAIEILDQAIYTTLRRGDVATRYSARQVIVILPETSEEDSKTVVGRIATEYEKQQRGGNIHLYYETAELK